MILGNLAEQCVSVELFVIEHEDRRAREPLAIKLAPDSLAPSRVGHGEMKRPLMQVVPKHTRGEMAQGIKVVVGDHLRLAAGAAGEIHQHGILVGIDKRRTDKAGRLAPLSLPVVEPLGYGLAVVGHRDECLHRGTLRHGLPHLLSHIRVIDTDDGLHTGPRVAVDDVVLGEHVGGRNDYGANLVERQHDDPPLIAPLEDEHDGIVLADAQREEIRGRLVRLLLELSVGGAYLVTQVVGPEDGELVGSFLSPHIHDVVGKIEILRNDKLQVLVIVFDRLEMGLL